MKKDLIYNKQHTLFGSREVIGFGSDDWHVKEIERSFANDLIIKNHYSKKYFNNSYIHLGVFINDDLLGVLQYGHLMNPQSSCSIVEGSDSYSCLELNRMWLDDKAERNSETMAISYSLRYIRSKFPKIKWIQSFADERCGCFGIVYQAASFSFYGEHVSQFYVLDNEYYHSTYFTNTTGKSASKSKKAEETRKRKGEVKIEKLRQFRYIKFIDKRLKKKCLLQEQPYPKYYNE
jgi:hypothetical protein